METNEKHLFEMSYEFKALKSSCKIDLTDKEKCFITSEFVKGKEDRKL